MDSVEEYIKLPNFGDLKNRLLPVIIVVLLFFLTSSNEKAKKNNNARISKR